MSGFILDSSYALSLFFIGGTMSGILGFLFLIAALCSQSLFKVEEVREKAY